MATTLIREQTLTKDDLNIYILKDGVLTSPYSITYTIYRLSSTCSEKVFDNEEPLVETIDSIPIPFGIGKYFAPWEMSTDLGIGNYRIKWNFREAPDKGIKQEAEEFTIVSRSCLSTDASSGGNFPHENPNGGLSEC